MLTAVDDAHRSGKCSRLWIMLTTVDTVHRSGKCSQLQIMLTTVDNVHRSGKCSQLWIMLTSNSYTPVRSALRGLISARGQSSYRSRAGRR